MYKNNVLRLLNVDHIEKNCLNVCFNNIKDLFTKPLALFDGTMAVKVTCNDFRTSFSVKGFNEVETRYKTSDGRTVKTTSESGVVTKETQTPEN